MGSFEQFLGVVSSSEAGGDFGKENLTNEASDPSQGEKNLSASVTN